MRQLGRILSRLAAFTVPRCPAGGEPMEIVAGEAVSTFPIAGERWHRAVSVGA